MAKSLWADGGSATPAELSTAALRSAPFLKTPAADLARSILDAGAEFHTHCKLGGLCACVSDCSRLHPLCLNRSALATLTAAVHWSVELVAAEGAEAVAGLTGVLSLAPHASRTDATQRELHALRLVGWREQPGWFRCWPGQQQ